MLPLVYTENRRRYITFANDCGVSDAARRGHVYEHHVFDRARTLPLTGTMVVDIGANFGFHSIEFSEMVGEDGGVMAFEPQTMVAKQMEANLFLNNINNVRVHNIALGNDSRMVDLELPDYMSEHTINIGNAHTDAYTTRRKQEIWMTKLDRHSVGHGTYGYRLDRTEKTLPISMMKIDVQGYELEVLEGAKATIAKHRPVIFIEIEPPQLAIYKKTPADVFRWFSDNNYHIEKVKDEPHLVDYIAMPK